MPSVQCPEAWPSNAVGPVVLTAAPCQKRFISESTSAAAGGELDSDPTVSRTAVSRTGRLVSIVMAGLQRREREDPLGELVLGENAEPHREYLLRLRVEQHDRGQRRSR